MDTDFIVLARNDVFDFSFSPIIWCEITSIDVINFGPVIIIAGRNWAA